LVLEYFVPRPNVGILHTSMPEMLEAGLIFYLEFDPTLLTLFPEVYYGMKECKNTSMGEGKNVPLP
jgi:hypothetical protein